MGAQSSRLGAQPTGQLLFRRRHDYSYGSHFPIARIVTLAKGPHKGEEIVYETTRDYSPTTGRHKHLVWSAIRRWNAKANPHTVTYKTGGVEHSYQTSGEWQEADRKVFEVFDPTANNMALSWSNRIKDAGELLTNCKKGTRQTTRARWFDGILSLIAQANAWAEYTGERYRWRIPDSIETLSAMLADARKKQESKEQLDRARREREYAERQQRIEAENADKITAWVAGEAVQFPYGIRTCYLRIQGDQVETSQGVTFPVDHARRAIPLVRAAIGKGFQRNGHTIHLGVYQLDRIEPDGTVYAGCHVVKYAEVERIAAQLGV
jgi:hypothetical protein